MPRRTSVGRRTHHRGLHRIQLLRGQIFCCGCRCVALYRFDTALHRRRRRVHLALADSLAVAGHKYKIGGGVFGDLAVKVLVIRDIGLDRRQLT